MYFFNALTCAHSRLLYKFHFNFSLVIFLAGSVPKFHFCSETSVLISVTFGCCGCIQYFTLRRVKVFEINKIFVLFYLSSKMIISFLCYDLRAIEAETELLMLVGQIVARKFSLERRVHQTYYYPYCLSTKPDKELSEPHAHPNPVVQ